MFNFFKKSQPNSNHILDVFKTLEDKQKESIISLFIVLAGSDQNITGGINKDEFSYINKHIDYFKLKNPFTILESYGIDGVLNNLRMLSEIQKKYLIVLTYGLLISDTQPNDIEILDMNKMFNEIGISSSTINETLKKII